MSKDHYATLGIGEKATAGEIRSAYRRLVLKHHPDRSSLAESKAIFLEVTDAYEVLGDPEKRKAYDAMRAVARRPTPTPPTAAPSRRPGPPPIEADLARLTLLFNRAQYAEAEKLAREVMAVDSRQAIPYAVLGDLARQRGNLDEAQRMYAYAAQMDPRNPIYQRRYENLLASSQLGVSGKRVVLQAEGPRPALAGVAGGASLLGAIYLAVSPEPAVLTPIGIVSTWTIGTLIALFLLGVVAGACLSAGNFVDRFEAAASTATGRSGPTVTLALVAIVSFPAAVALYLGLGLAQRTFNYSTTRMVVATACVLGILSLGAGIGGRVDPLQVLLWGGNLTYLGGLVGWLVADAFRN